MKRTLLFAALSAASIFVVQAASAATFSYHGVLQDAGKPAQGKYDIELTLYSSQSGGSVVGGPMTLYAVPVQDGSFSTDADFGPLSNSMSQAFVAVKVRPAGSGSFTALAERSSVVDTNTSCPGSWSLDGNAGNPSGSYLGTADNKALVFKSNNAQVATAFVSASGPVPVWLGGLFNTFGGQGGFVGGGGGTSSSDSAHANTVGSFGVVGGGQSNHAGSSSISYATVGGGSSNTASGQYSTVGGGSSVSATGVGATVPGGEVNQAAGIDSFAAGSGAIAAHDQSFVWSDGHALFSDDAAQQFDIQANGGMAINGAPKNNGVELSIYPSANGGNFSNVFYGLQSAAGILTSAGGAATPTSNDASFFFDDYNGTVQNRIFSIAPGVITVAGNPSAAGIYLVPGIGDAKVVMATIGSGLNSTGFEIDVNPIAGGSGYSMLNIDFARNLTVFGPTATKPGGGMWSAPSDRRIKQDIEPIHDAVDTLMKLRPVNFHYTPQYRAMEGGLADKSYEGFIAQEYAEVFPSDVISTDKHVPGANKNDPTILELDSSSAVITTVAAVQELAVENAALRKEVDALTRRLGKLETAKGN
ncbi:MAG: tail fiber domain-containing protein [Dokdonella sp.]